MNDEQRRRSRPPQFIVHRSEFIVSGDTEVAMYGNGRPIGNRKKVQLLVALTLLAWATQTLFRQWARGADLPPPPAAASGANGAADLSAPAPDAPVPPVAGDSPAPAAERFVPASPRPGLGATLELRGEATVFGPEVRL